MFIAIGLIVAVPAVLGYNMVVRRNKVALERVRNFSADIHAVLLAGGARRAEQRCGFEKVSAVFDWLAHGSSRLWRGRLFGRLPLRCELYAENRAAAMTPTMAPPSNVR